MTCATCGASATPGQKFCGDCGSPLAQSCPACGATNPPGQRFCGTCGTGLTDAARPSATALPAARTPGAPTGHEPVAERRLVTILFADLVGFTSFSEGRDAEEVRETLSRYFELASAVVGRFGGSIEKFIGDAVMAVWGTPTAREDDAERAVRAALDLVDAVAALGPGIQARAGVLTGEAAVTLGATNQGMVAGDLVNTASRLQSVAPTGSVLVGDATFRAASRAITFDPVGEVELKGKAAPVPAWRAVRVVADLGGRGARETLEAPFVGRDGELRLMRDLYHATERERRVRLVSVLGVGGIGKSRLIREFEKYIDGMVGDVWWHQGRSPAYDQGITFWALADMVRARARLNDAADEAETRTAIAALVDRVMGDDPLRGWVEPALLELLGVRSGIAADELFGAWRTFFERLGGDSAVVLVFQDLHWADQGTLQFIDHLLEWSRGTAMYVITLARPELLDRRPDWGAGQRSFTSVHLEPLSDEEMRALLHGLVPGLPDSAVAAIAGRAEGVPLYAIETVRMLLASGALGTDEDGVVRPVGDLTELAVPETLTALIAARLDALEPADRSLLLDAAVLGQSFTPAGLAAISGSGIAEIEPRLRSLVRREVLTAITDPISPERGQYQFVQALIREVAYHTLARRDRKVRHLAAARWFESLGEDELAGALAGHYLAARENATDAAEADALAAQARIALRAAAERAAALGSLEQAVRFAEQAIAVTTAPADLAELESLAAGADMTLSRYDDGERHYLAAITQLDAIEDRSGAVLANARLIRDLLTGRRLERADELIHAVEPVAATLSADDPARLLLRSQQSRLAFFRNEFDAAIALADEVLTVAEREDELAILGDVLVTKGTVLLSIGRRREGTALLHAGRQVAEAAGMSSIALRAMNNLMSSSVDADPATAMVTAREGIALAQRLGQGYWVQSMIGNMAYAALRTGDWAAAIELASDALRSVEDRNDRVVLVNNLANLLLLRGDPQGDELLAELQVTIGAAPADDVVAQTFLKETLSWKAFAAGNLDDARRQWGEVVRMDPTTAGTAASWVGRIEAWQGDTEAATARIRQHHESSGRGGSADGTDAVLQGVIAASQGDRALGVQRFRDAARVFRSLHIPVDEAFIAFDALHVLGPDDPYTQEILPGARATFARVGAVPLVERLDELAAASGRSDVVRPVAAADAVAGEVVAG